eukprot:495928_1
MLVHDFELFFPKINMSSHDITLTCKSMSCTDAYISCVGSSNKKIFILSPNEEEEHGGILFQYNCEKDKWTELMGVTCEDIAFDSFYFMIYSADSDKLYLLCNSTTIIFDINNIKYDIIKHVPINSKISKTNGIFIFEQFHFFNHAYIHCKYDFNTKTMESFDTFINKQKEKRIKIDETLLERKPNKKEIKVYYERMKEIYTKHNTEKMNCIK